MENTKVSKKALNSLLHDSMREVIGKLDLPKPTKKIRKIVDRSTKKLAAVYADILKKKNKKVKKQTKSLLFVEDVLQNKKDKKSIKRSVNHPVDME